MFQNDHVWAAEGGKNNWLRHQATMIGVHNNAPLTYLVREFGKLVKIASFGISDKTLEYDDVLKVFNKALESHAWPKDDESIPYKLPDLRTNDIRSNPEAPKVLVDYDDLQQRGSTKRKASDEDSDDDSSDSEGPLTREFAIDGDGDTTMENRSPPPPSPAPRPTKARAKPAQPPKRRRVISDALQVQLEDAEMQDGPSRPRTRSRTASRPERAPAPAPVPAPQARARPVRRAASRPERGPRGGRAEQREEEEVPPTVESLKEWGGPATGTRGRRLKKDSDADVTAAVGQAKEQIGRAHV